MRRPRYCLMYVTLIRAATMFLFVVGFCLPVSASRAGGNEGASLGKWAARGRSNSPRLRPPLAHDRTEPADR